MQQFVRTVTAVLGTTEQVARTVTGGLLDIIAKTAPQADVASLLNNLPGATDLLNAFRAAPPPPPPPDPTFLESLSNLSAAVVGTGVAGLSSLNALMKSLGLDVSKVPQLVLIFAQYAVQQAGPDLAMRVLGAVPGVSAIVGTLGSIVTPNKK